MNKSLDLKNMAVNAAHNNFDYAEQDREGQKSSADLFNLSMNRSWIPSRIIPPQSYSSKLSWRKGKWLEEEEAYTKKLIDAFSAGYLNIPSGTTLRSFLSEKLCCDPMRITKKFAGSSCIGKQVFTPCDPKVDPSIIQYTENELKEFEEKFRSKIELQRANEFFPSSSGSLGTPSVPLLNSMSSTANHLGPQTTMRSVLIDLPTEYLKNPQAAALLGFNLHALSSSAHFANHKGALSHYMSAPDLQNFPYQYFTPSFPLGGITNSGNNTDSNGQDDFNHGSRLQDIAAELRFAQGLSLPSSLTATATDSATIASILQQQQQQNQSSSLPPGVLLATDTRSLARAAAGLTNGSSHFLTRPPSMPLLPSSTSSFHFTSRYSNNNNNAAYGQMDSNTRDNNDNLKDETFPTASSSLTSLPSVDMNMKTHRPQHENALAKNSGDYQNNYHPVDNSAPWTTSEEDDLDESNLLINFFKTASKNAASESTPATSSGSKRKSVLEEEEEETDRKQNRNDADHTLSHMQMQESSEIISSEEMMTSKRPRFESYVSVDNTNSSSGSMAHLLSSSVANSVTSSSSNNTNNSEGGNQSDNDNEEVSPLVVNRRLRMNDCFEQSIVLATTTVQS